MMAQYFILSCFARISRVRKRQRQDTCKHVRLSMTTYDEQREREMRSISSLLMHL